MRPSGLREVLLAIGVIAGANAVDAGEHTAHARPKFAAHGKSESGNAKAAERALTKALKPLENDPAKFLEKARELGPKLPFDSLVAFIRNHPRVAIDNVAVFNHYDREAFVVYFALPKLDLYSAAEWAETHRDIFERVLSGLNDVSNKDPNKALVIKDLKSVPSLDTAGLIVSFFLKHQGKAIDWEAVRADIEEFRLADELLKKHTFIKGYVGALESIDAKTYKIISVYQTNITSIVRIANGDEARKIQLRDDEGAKVERASKEWGKKFGSENPLALAKLAVLVVRDLAMRGAEDSEGEVRKSLERITSGRNAIASKDILRGRDLAVLISGDNDRNAPAAGNEADGPERVNERLDWNSYAKIKDLWQKANSGTDEKMIRVPFSKEGKVNIPDLISAKSKYLEFMASAGRARTVIIATHGSEKTISMFGDPVRGVDSTLVAISPEEFAQAHMKRISQPGVRESYAAGNRDVYLFTQCLSFDFARKIYAILKERKMPLPIIIASGEIGTSNIYRLPSSQRDGYDYFLNTVGENLGRGFGAIANNALSLAQSGIYSPIVIFIPDEDERPLQVTEISKTRV